MQSILSLAPRCPTGSLVPYKSEEHHFCGLFLRRELCAGWGLQLLWMQRIMLYPTLATICLHPKLLISFACFCVITIIVGP